MDRKWVKYELEKREKELLNLKIQNLQKAYEDLIETFPNKFSQEQIKNLELHINNLKNLIK